MPESRDVLKVIAKMVTLPPPTFALRNQKKYPQANFTLLDSPTTEAGARYSIPRNTCVHFR